MKTFRDFILECELVEGKVEWDNPKRPLQSGLTPREKNKTRRIATGVEDADSPSFYKGGPGEKEYDRYAKLKAAHDTEKDKKVPANKRHNFKKEKYTGKTRGQTKREIGAHKVGWGGGKKEKTRRDRYKLDLKEPKD